MPKRQHTRRRFIRLAGGVAGAGLSAPRLGARAADAAYIERLDREVRASIADTILALGVDAGMRTRLWRVGAGPRGGAQVVPITAWRASEYLLLADGRRLERFELATHRLERIDGEEGPGLRLRLTGRSAEGLVKQLSIETVARHPGMARCRLSFVNRGPEPIQLAGWVSHESLLPPAGAAGSDREARLFGDPAARGTEARQPGEFTTPHPPGEKAAPTPPQRHALAEAAGTPPFWAYCGSTHGDRRDWLQPVWPGFVQHNYMGMGAPDYGGGTPVTDVWRRDCGIAVGHLEPRPQLLSLPLRCTPEGAQLAVQSAREQVLAPGATLELPLTFIALHTGDHFAVVDAYRRVMTARGLSVPPAPPSAYEPIWCAWGYERSCTPELIVRTLPKVRELGLKWAVVDDGWQTNTGDWQPDPAKYPARDADMRRLVERIRAENLKPRLWYAPLMAPPGSDLLHEHPDMLLLDADGAAQNVSWWNAFYLCPAYAPTVRHMEGLVRRFVGDWGYLGLKIDGQHLDAVAPCYNPAHRHARPEESCEALQDYMHALYAAAVSQERDALVEWCPCGTGYSYFNFTAMNQAPASDPESSWQVRHKGKTLKALMGPGGAYAGDHVELSDGGDDFASTVGIGGVVSTKFTWPVDPKPKDSFLLTPEREGLWRRWIALYEALQLPLGDYRGELYDIGFDRPEMHAIERRGRMYYACYAPGYEGTIELRGLARGRHRVRDCWSGAELGVMDARAGRIEVRFERALLIEATRIA